MRMPKLQRFLALCLITLSMALLMAACGDSTPTAAPGTAATAATVATTAAATTSAAAATTTAASGQSFAGIKLTILIHPTLYNATGGDEGVIKAFEASTGAKVEVVKSATPELYEKLNVEFVAGSGRYDLATVETSALNKDIFKNLLKIDDRLAAAPDFNTADIIPALMKEANFQGGQYGLPVRTNASIVYYRKDLLAKAGATEIPKDFPSFMTLVTKMNQEGVNGLILRGKGVELAHDYLALLYAHNGQPLTDDQSACALNTPQALQAATRFYTLYKDGVLPKDMLALGRDDYIAAYQTGRAAAGIYQSSYWDRLVSPKDSKFGDQIGWALVPTDNGAPVGTSRGGSWHVVIDKNSKQKDAAFALAMALTNKENQIKMAVDFGNGPIRDSSYQAPSYKAKFPAAATWLEALKVTKVDPANPHFTAILDNIAAEISGMMQGQKSPEQALKDACTRIDRELKK
jgi:ABC-type glycerol-3-phosphate transport system substrate-binding protein